VLVAFVVLLVLVAVGVLAVAKVAQIAMRRLGLELDGVLLWVGVAEDPVDDVAAEARLRWAGEPNRI
jgi:hypothetical protein